MTDEPEIHISAQRLINMVELVIRQSLSEPQKDMIRMIVTTSHDKREFPRWMSQSPCPEKQLTPAK